MSTISNFMLANLAERLTPLLQTPVEDIVYEILDRKGLPTRSEIRDLKNRLERIDEEVKKLNEELARYRDLETAPAAAPEVEPEAAQPEAAQPEVTQFAPDEPVAEEAVAEEAVAEEAVAEEAVAEEAVAQPPVNEAAPVEPPKKRRGRPPRQGPPPICEVQDCALAVRSKGFCAKHYQAWRRGRLPGFVDPEGMLLLDDTGLKIKVDKRYGAEAATFSFDGDRVLIQVKGKELKRKKPAQPKAGKATRRAKAKK